MGDPFTTYDKYGRPTGRTEYTTHGRPDVHTNPHYHDVDTSDPDNIYTGDATPGEHPDLQ